MRLKVVVVVALIAVGVVLAVGLSRPAQTNLPPASRGEFEALTDRLQELETSTASDLGALEARIAALEGAPIREGAPAPDAWSDADVAALRAGLERIKVVEQRDREAQRFRQVVAHVIPDAKPAARERTVALLQDTIEAVRRDPEMSGPLRGELLRKLVELFPEEIANRLAGLVPGGDPSEESR